MSGSANFSPCGLYRYRLERLLESGDGTVLWVMLNPSTADADHDDNTIRRVKAFSQSWGFRRALVGNVYAFRSTNPRGLWTADDPTGPDNPKHLHEMAAEASLIIAAWGQHVKRADVEPVEDLLRMYGNVWCLGTGRGEKPKHPLMLPADTQRTLYAPRLHRPEVA